MWKLEEKLDSLASILLLCSRASILLLCSLASILLLCSLASILLLCSQASILCSAVFKCVKRSELLSEIIHRCDNFWNSGQLF